MTEYSDAFNRLVGKKSFKAQTWFGDRKSLVEQYSWAVPSDEVIEYIASHGPVQELGAGSGYWAYELHEADADIRAIDIDSPEETWYPVTQGDESLLDDRPLLLVWPPVHSEMATRALRAHGDAGGSDVFYVGEWDGCTANREFHDILETEYTFVKSMDIPSYKHIYDNFYHYQKS